MTFKISFVICTYNNKKLVEKCINSILLQDYDKSKIEIITVDGGSTDGTLNILKRFPVKIIHNKKRFPEGKGMGKSQGIEKASGDIIILLDQDNELINHNWLKNSIVPFTEDPKVFGCACKMSIDKNDTITNRYLSMVGTDPFAIYRSLEGKMALNNIKLINKGKYYIYDINKEDMLCTGGNCFLIRKKCLDLINGYVQDVDMIYSLVLKNINRIAILKNTYIHHRTAKSYIGFLKKRWMWGKHYSFNNNENRIYSWFPKKEEYLNFFIMIFLNLTFFYHFIVSLERYKKTKEVSWILHAPSMFFVTLFYIIFGISNLNKFIK